MKAVLFDVDDVLKVVDIPIPACPPGGLLVESEACGLCSGELMTWYLRQKAPHVLGHEVAGIVVESQNPRFPIGTRVAPHHHVACGQCESCLAGRHVFCPRWKKTNLVPGGMSECFALSSEHLAETFQFDETDPKDAALLEPLGCCLKSISRSGLTEKSERALIVGAGALGLLHARAILAQFPQVDITLTDLNPARREHAASLGLQTCERTDIHFDCIIVCPGHPSAIQSAIAAANPNAVIVLFAPLEPGQAPPSELGSHAYFKDLHIRNSYSCGPVETTKAAELIRNGKVSHHGIVSDFVSIDGIVEAHAQMTRGEILKPMVIF